MLYCLDFKAEVFEWKEMGEALARVVGVDIFGRGFVILLDIVLFLKLLIDFIFIILLSHKK